MRTEATERENPGPATMIETVPDRAARKKLMNRKLVAAVDTSGGWGWLPALALTQALGLFVVAQANLLAKAGREGAAFYWLGLLLILAPVALRMTRENLARRERVALVVTLAASMYLVKIVHSPLAPTFSDELVHQTNVAAILKTGHLFSPNTILPVTPFYPGLHIATALLANLGGLSSFAAGLVVVGTGRILLLLSLFLVIELISGSDRVAGLAVVVYLANSNYLYWTAQFAYESLALPLAGVIIFAAAASVSQNAHQDRRGMRLTAFTLILTVVMTHHLTSYAVAAFLVAATILFFVVAKRPGPWRLALVAAITAVAWLLLVASSTVGYLGPVLTGAFGSLFDLLAGQESTRALFSSSGSTTSTPLWERLVALASIPLIVLGLLAGLWVVWQKYRRRPLALLLTATGLAYVPVQALRLTRAGWETANRASEFLFLGVSFLLALALLYPWKVARQHSRLAPLAIVSYLIVLFFAGIIGGWQPNLRTGQPFNVSVSGQVLEPQGLVAARWAETHLGSGNVMIGDRSNARLMLLYGGQKSYTGRAHGVRDLLFGEHFDSSAEEILGFLGVDYVVFDRRRVSWDNMLGIYFERLPAGTPLDERRLPGAAERKFDDAPGVERLFDSGNVVIFDVREGYSDHAAE